MRSDVVRRTAVTLGLLAVPALVAAQGAQAASTGEPPVDMKFEVTAGGPGGEGPLDRIVMVRAEESFEARLVKGAPYQAEAVTEFVQALADGNRIVRRSSSTVARDGEGRTRREHGLAAIGPMVAGGGPEMRSVFINDPVAGVTWILEPGQKIARKMARPGPGMPLDKEIRSEDKDGRHVERIVIRRPGEGGADGPGLFTRRLPKPETEDLGTKTIEGLEAKGTRSTVTIPAGEMGNEKPLVIVTERWYSPELSTVVLSKHSDPRMGETTYRLTQISRGEPDRSLFEVPSDYTVKEGGPGHSIRIERRKDEPKQ